MVYKINVITSGLCPKDSDTLLFAAAELRRCLSPYTEDSILLMENAPTGDAVTLGIGLGELPTVADRAFDDAIFIDVGERRGTIAGTNARSVLIAVYRYLRECGFVFIRPGRIGEIFPATLPDKNIHVAEAASECHRCVCIEGSVSYESVRDMIDWLPKIGMNSYFIQFFTPSIFFRRYYEQDCGELANPCFPRTSLSDEEIDAMTRSLVREIKKRGLLYHAVGHGWTCRPFGMPSAGWNSVDTKKIPKDAYRYLAMIGGERKLFLDRPINTNLCYGNPKVRDKVTDCIVGYCREHPEIDYLHFWLADAGNNHCECELCRDSRPSDLYVKMLNELDGKMTAAGLPQKIVFLMYMDLLWAPEKEKIRNPDRFLCMFAPISRSYSHSLGEKPGIKVPPYERNRLTFPKDVGNCLAFLKPWREAYAGECVIFDYHFMWDCYKDIGCTGTARVLREDIRAYPSLGFDGLISCQCGRIFTPTALGMNMMARVLWNRDCDYIAERDDILRSEFGEDYAKVAEYLETLSKCYVPEVLRIEKPIAAAENVASYQKGLAFCQRFRAEIENHLEKGSELENASWNALGFHVGLAILLFETCLSFAKGENADGMWEKIEDYVNRREWQLRDTFDVYEFKYLEHQVFNHFRKK